MASEARMEYAEFEKIAPGVRDGLTALSKAVSASGLDRQLIELIKIRASQINGCAYCLEFHLTYARRLGVVQTKLDLVAVWRDAGIFSAKEMAALAWMETLTGVTSKGVSNDAYAAVKKEFTENEVVFLTSAVAAINAWNRIAMAFRFTPPIPQEKA
ncbi:alkyl hydroperoxide reductase AhpD [Edaphobacter acidisoli]|uniref:Alkyl hydroperoxide reductase AhpD n=1 Tax=Edaphobacter acidisoli TaxID=2040573 RepID=A0A916W792_9BACT|nr:carboxymuconolactone decarboxylase family protein [Edaphobacter acidisoli]GGA71825.1 alkyl hydroperoxide reductase AhpD [Edaphobacter acidisoli]